MTNSSSRNPMELIDRYLQAVRFWLPKSQHDLALELAEDLHSQVEAKKAELGRPLDEGEVSAILRECGRPAGQYQSPPSWTSSTLARPSTSIVVIRTAPLVT